MKTDSRSPCVKRSVVAVAIVLSVGACRRDHPVSTTVVAFTHATVIDVTGGPSQSDMTILVDDGQIKELGTTESVSLPASAQVYDASGKFVIPGLWDMHVHTLSRWRVGNSDVDLFESFFPLFIANGVTGVRDMNGNADVLRLARQRIERGEMRGPRVVASGPIVDGAQWPFGSIAVTSQEDGRNAVRQLAEEGSDFIKVGGLTPRGAYFGVAEAAQELGLPFVGHVPFQLTAGEAVTAGQRSIEHLDGVLLGCSSNESKLRSDAEAFIEAEGDFSYLWLARVRAEFGAMDGLDSERCSALISLFAEQQTWHVPTLVLKRATAFMDDSSITEDPRLAHIPDYLLQTWGPDNGLTGKYTPEDYANDKRVFSRQLELVDAMHKSGVPFMAGTDTVDPYIFAGSSVHDEMELFVLAGLTPLEALQTATWNPARFLGMSDSLGAVAAGMAADLVFLNANPLEDIGNTRQIWAVVLDGEVLAREAIDDILNASRGIAASGRTQQ